MVSCPQHCAVGFAYAACGPPQLLAGSLENMKSICFSYLQTARSGAAVKDVRSTPRSGGTSLTDA